MVTSQVYIIISIFVLLCVGLLVYILSKRKNKYKLTPLAGIALGFILVGLFFVDDRFIGYGLLAIGVMLAVIDIYIRSKQV